jgi:hypothetical protein
MQFENGLHMDCLVIDKRLSWYKKWYFFLCTVTPWWRNNTIFRNVVNYLRSTGRHTTEDVTTQLHGPRTPAFVNLASCLVWIWYVDSHFRDSTVHTVTKYKYTVLRKISETTRDKILGLLECYITGHIAIYKGHLFYHRSGVNAAGFVGHARG